MYLYKFIILLKKNKNTTHKGRICIKNTAINYIATAEHLFPAKLGNLSEDISVRTNEKLLQVSQKNLIEKPKINLPFNRI